VTLPPEKWAELLDKPAAPFLDSKGAQSISPTIARATIEIAFLHQFREACFQAARVGLEKAPEIISGSILCESFSAEPEHQLQDLIPPVYALKARITLAIMLTCHGSLQGL
jgi:hypothetical protein